MLLNCWLLLLIMMEDGDGSLHHQNPLTVYRALVLKP